MKCSTCGTENKEDSKFCYACGTSLTATPPPAPAPPPPPAVSPRPRVPYKQPYQDILGLLGLAFVLVSLGLVFSANPSLGSELRLWGERAAANGPFVRPPQGVITSAALFFVVIGFLEFVSAVLRWSLRWTWTHVLSRVLTGAGDLVFAYLLVLYSGFTISGFLLVSILAATMGVLLLVYITLGLYWATVRAPPRTEATEAGQRP